MIYICTETKPSYTLACEHEIIDNNLCSFSDEYRHMRGVWQLYNRENLPDEVGVFQKRRALSVFTIPDGYDVVVPECVIWPYKNMRYFYIACRANVNDIYAERDMDLVEQIISDPLYGDYIRTPDNHECYWHNMFIMKKDDFKRYCKFMFDVLFEKDKHVGTLCNWGISEWIGSYWIWKNFSKEKIFCAKMVEFQKLNR